MSDTPTTTYVLTERDRSDIARIEAELAALQLKIDRHERTSLSGEKTNPAGDIGGIRSWSKRKKERMWNRYDREAKTGVKLYTQRQNLRHSIEWITSGRRAEWEHWQALWGASKAKRKAARRPTVKRGPRPPKPQPTADELKAYNDRAYAVYLRCEAERRAVQHLRSKDYYDLDSQRAAGIASAWTEVDSTIAGQHMRGEMASVAQVRATLIKARAQALKYQEEQRQPGALLSRGRECILEAVDARCEAEVETIDHILGLLDRGELAL